MKRKLLPVLIGALSMVALAQRTPQPRAATQPATSQPSSGQASSPQARRPLSAAVTRLLKMQNAATVTGDISEGEWKSVQDFMEAHSPDRMRQLRRLPPEKIQNLKRSMVGRFRMLEEVRKSDPTLYEIWVNKLEVEDDRFTLLRDLRRGRGDARENETKLRNNVAEGVRLELDERQHRLENLEHVLDDEKAKLAEDRKNEDTLISDQLAKSMNGGPFGGPGRLPEGLRAPDSVRPEGSRPEGVREAAVETPTTAPDTK